MRKLPDMEEATWQKVLAFSDWIDELSDEDASTALSSLVTMYAASFVDGAEGREWLTHFWKITQRVFKRYEKRQGMDRPH